MKQRVTLTFVVDTTEDEAWDIADGLESAARKKDFMEINAYVTVEDRGGVLGTEDAPIKSSAEMVTRRTQVGAPMGFGGLDGTDMITLGGDDGRSG